MSPSWHTDHEQEDVSCASCYEIHVLASLCGAMGMQAVSLQCPTDLTVETHPPLPSVPTPHSPYIDPKTLTVRC